MKKLAILGAGGHGKVVADTASACGWQNIFFFDQSANTRVSNDHWPIIGNQDQLLNSLNSFDGVIVAIGDCKTRHDAVKTITTHGGNLITLIHPSATVSQFASIDIGSVVFAGAVINVDVKIGIANIINTGSTIDHDSILGDAVHIAPGAHLSGAINIGHNTWIGVGASIKQGINIGKNVMVGAGSVVVRDVPDNVTVVGNPAKLLMR